MAPQDGGTTEIFDPLAVTVPFHVLVITAPVGNLNVSFQLFTAVEPLFLIVELRQNPPAHVESLLNPATSAPALPVGVGVAEVSVGVGVAEVSVGVGVAVTVGVGDGVPAP